MNSVYLTYAADFEMHRLNDEPDATMVIMELCFLVFYSAELILKLVVHRIYFFCNDSMGWNIFDLTLVLQAIGDAFMIQQHSNLTFARIVRLFKLGKVFRLLRALRFARELRVMVLSILGSAAALFWSFVMLALILYVFALLFVQTMVAYAIDHEDDTDLQAFNDVTKYFPSVATGMLTLYQCASGGLDWQEVYDVVCLSGFVSSFLFLFFLLFFNFSVLNILTGIFLEQALHNSQPDRDALMLHQRRKDEAEVIELTRLFHKMDRNESGTLTYSEFMEYGTDSEMTARLSTLGLDIKDTQQFFEVIAEISGSHILLIDDFVKHCTKMKGTATGIDLQVLSYQVRLLQRCVEKLSRPSECNAARVDDEYPELD